MSLSNVLSSLKKLEADLEAAAPTGAVLVQDVADLFSQLKGIAVPTFSCGVNGDQLKQECIACCERIGIHPKCQTIGDGTFLNAFLQNIPQLMAFITAILTAFGTTPKVA